MREPASSRRAAPGGRERGGAGASRSRPRAAGPAADLPGADGDPFEACLARWELLLTGGPAAGGADLAVPVPRGGCGGPADPERLGGLDAGSALDALDAAAAAVWTAWEASAGHRGPWTDLAPREDGADMWLGYQRLRTLAVAWATPGAALGGRPEVVEAVVRGLDLLHRHAYAPDRPETGNWWHWEIGVPRALMDVCVLVRAHLPSDRLDAYLRAAARFCPDPDTRTKTPGVAETGANRADKAVIVALSGLLARDADRVAAAVGGLSDTRGGGRNSVFAVVTDGDGFHRDGSFVQHDRVAYTGAYGVVLLECVAQLAALVHGTPWAVADPAVGVVFEAVERSFAPFVFEGRMMDAVRGRGISRQRGRDHHAGAALTAAVLLLSTVAPAGLARRWRELAKGWIARDGGAAYARLATVPQVRLAGRLLADPGVTARPRPVGHRVFPEMDRVVHHRPGWAAALAISSRRTAAYECGNGENLHGWYTGDGMLYVYRPDDADQYADEFWPTVDPYRLPGTTVDTRRREDVGRGSGTGTGARPAAGDLAGGAALAGRFGAAAFDLVADGSSLRAHKAWFFTDDAVVALGAGIRAADGTHVETVVENRCLHADGAGRLLVDGQAYDTAGASRVAPAHWAHLEGTGGYLFPGGADLRVLRERRSGTWRSIDIGGGTGGDEVRVQRHFATLWLDHGRSPDGRGYAYVLLPGATARETAAASRRPPVRVLANTCAVQAVDVPGTGVRAAVFRAAARAGGVESDGTACVLVRRRGPVVSVAVSDPGHRRSRVRVRLPWPTGRTRACDPAVTVRHGSRPVLTVDTSGSQGRTHTAELSAT